MSTTIDLGIDRYAGGDMAGLYTSDGSKGWIGRNHVAWCLCADKRGEPMVPYLFGTAGVISSDGQGMADHTGSWEVGEIVDLGEHGSFRIETNPKDPHGRSSDPFILVSTKG